jgi:hypothetical protein
MGTRYKVTKQQLEMVVESFVKENKKSMNESQLMTEGMIDNFIDTLKKAVEKLKSVIMDMAKKDPEVMSDLKMIAKKAGQDPSALDAGMAESILGENKELMTEGMLNKIIGRITQALGLTGLGVSIPAFASQLMGYTDSKWLTQLHNYLEPYCNMLPHPTYCGPFAMLAIGLSVLMIFRGVIRAQK